MKTITYTQEGRKLKIDIDNERKEVHLDILLKEDYYEFTIPLEDWLG